MLSASNFSESAAFTSQSSLPVCNVEREQVAVLRAANRNAVLMATPRFLIEPFASLAFGLPVVTPLHFAGCGIERDGGKQRRDVHHAAVDERIVSRAVQVRALEHAHRPQCCRIRRRNLLQIHEAHTCVVVIGQQPFLASGRLIQFYPVSGPVARVQTGTSSPRQPRQTSACEAPSSFLPFSLCVLRRSRSVWLQCNGFHRRCDRDQLRLAGRIAVHLEDIGNHVGILCFGEDPGALFGIKLRMMKNRSSSVCCRPPSAHEKPAR
jgi:hypothetical protein